METNSNGLSNPASTLHGAIVLITGGGRGLGRLYAQHLASEGAVLALVARSEADLKEVARSIERRGGRVSTFVADVADMSAVQRVVERVEEELGPIDVLINNAGILGPIGNAWECDWDTWWRAIEVNLGGTAAFSHAVIPKMAERRRGRVVNMVSEAGALRWPTVSAYSVSKAALIKFSENLASECRDFQLSVFAYHPGYVAVGMSNAALDLRTSSNPAEAKVGAWSHALLEAGEVDSPEASAAVLVSLLSGNYDVLSGRYITVRDDLDALVKRVEGAGGLKDLRMLRPLP